MKIEYIGSEKDIKAGLGRIVGWAYPDATPLYRKKYISNGVDTGMEVIMGDMNGHGVVMGIDAPSITTEEEMREMVENSIKNGLEGRCTYCEEASKILNKVSRRVNQNIPTETVSVNDEPVQGELGQDETIEQVKEEPIIPNPVTEEFKNVEQGNDLLSELGFIPIKDAILTPKQLLRSLLG